MEGEILAALRTLVDLVAHYAPEMDRNGDLDEARWVLRRAEAPWLPPFEEVSR